MGHHRPGVTLKGCMEIHFLFVRDIEKFCLELEKCAIEGLCTCVCTKITQLLEDKLNICERRPLLESEKYLTTWWVKAL
jgi:hypothetical protein